MKKTDNKNFSRRKFVKTGLLASSFFVVPRHVLGGTGFTAPSDQLVLVAIGAGGKGTSDIINASRNGKERVVGLCDVDPRSEGVMKSREAFPKADFYVDFRRMLDREKDVDAVTISTPDHMHAFIAMYAMQRGKHVYVQKPLTHDIQEARLLTETARKQKVVTQMGNQGASNPSLIQMREWIDSGMIGKVNRVYVWTNRPVWPQGIPMPKPDKSQKPENFEWDLWLGTAPEREYTPHLHPFNWRGFWDFGTGALGDMGCHLLDVPYRLLGLGYPTAVECSVASVYSKMWEPDYIPEACPPSSSVTLYYAPTDKTTGQIEMTWMDGGIKPAIPELIPENLTIDEFDNDNGVIMIGEKGILTCGTYGMSPKLYRPNEEPLIYKAPTEQEQEEPEWGHPIRWVEACKAGFNSAEHKKLTSSFDYAGPLTETVLMGNIAIRSYMLRKEKPEGGYDYYGRKRLIREGDNIKIANLEEANQFVARQYRKGWELR